LARTLNNEIIGVVHEDSDVVVAQTIVVEVFGTARYLSGFVITHLVRAQTAVLEFVE
jgi:hypothetical protein